MSSDLGKVSAVVASEGINGIKKFKITLFNPIRPMLADRIISEEEAVKKILNKFAAEYKLDGERVQIHKMDNKIIRTIIEKFNGGPVGLKTIATACSEEADTIEEVYEPFLIQEGFLKRTNRGRQITQLGYKHLNIPAPKNNQNLLFE